MKREKAAYTAAYTVEDALRLLKQEILRKHGEIVTINQEPGALPRVTFKPADTDRTRTVVVYPSKINRTMQYAI